MGGIIVAACLETPLNVKLMANEAELASIGRLAHLILLKARAEDRRAFLATIHEKATQSPGAILL